VTSLTGEEQVKEAGRQTIFFRQGLPGLGSSKQYNLYAVEENPFFYYLQSVEEQEIGLIVTDPFTCFPGYSVDLSAEDLQELEVEKQEDVLVLTTVTFRGEKSGKKSMTTNLAAPIVINTRTKLARQVFIAERIDQMRMPLDFGQK